MEAIILAGGKGTRLRDVVSNVPKPMAQINNRPFLSYLLDYVLTQGITRCILATGYMHEAIFSYFGSNYKGLLLDYSIEDRALGTGGAIAKALKYIKGETAFVINGDTYFDVCLPAMMENHTYYKADITIAIKDMEAIDRYGTVELERNRIVAFKEKTFVERGLINGGIYLLPKRIFSAFAFPKCFSFERDLLEQNVKQLNISGYSSNGYFIDIGVPEDYYRAQTELKT